MGDNKWDKSKESKKLTNAEFASTDAEFQRACAKEKVDPTPRQSSKWRSKRGAAYYLHRKLKRSMGK